VVKPGGVVLGVIASDIDAIYHDDGSAVKIPTVRLWRFSHAMR
jgi:hypothetical protein